MYCTNKFPSARHFTSALPAPFLTNVITYSFFLFCNLFVSFLYFSFSYFSSSSLYQFILSLYLFLVIIQPYFLALLLISPILSFFQSSCVPEKSKIKPKYNFPSVKQFNNPLNRHRYENWNIGIVRVFYKPTKSIL